MPDTTPSEPSAIEPLLTERLILRAWREDDLPAFAVMNADPEVMRHYPSTLDRAQSDALVERIRRRMHDHGVGLFALELRVTGLFIGYTGLAPMPEWSPGAGFFEIGWRLRQDAWGHGYATEAARRCLDLARERGEREVWSLTATTNTRSVAVMRRLGLRYVTTQGHPALPIDHRLHQHVFYRLPLDELPGPNPSLGDATTVESRPSER